MNIHSYIPGTSISTAQNSLSEHIKNGNARKGGGVGRGGVKSSREEIQQEETEDQGEETFIKSTNKGGFRECHS